MVQCHMSRDEQTTRQGRREIYSVFYLQFGASGISYDHDTWERRDTPHIFYFLGDVQYVCVWCLYRSVISTRKRYQQTSARVHKVVDIRIQ